MPRKPTRMTLPKNLDALLDAAAKSKDYAPSMQRWRTVSLMLVAGAPGDSHPVCAIAPRNSSIFRILKDSPGFL